MKDDHGGQGVIARETRTLQDLLREDRRLGRVAGWAFGPDEKAPCYSYLAGDITKAYGAKAKKVTRSMVTWDTGDEIYPCIFVVYDHVVSSDPAFKKAWYLHSLQEPVISGLQTTIICNGSAYYGGQYGGQLVVETLLPSKARIEKVGGPGKECWNEAMQTNYGVDLSGPRAKGDELGAWRIEVMPAQPATDDRFLNVLTAMDAGTSAPKIEGLESDALVGACVARHVVLFNATDERRDQVSFALPDADSYAILICGLTPGVWMITKPDGAVQTREVSNTGKCLYLDGDGGFYQMVRK